MTKKNKKSPEGGTSDAQVTSNSTTEQIPSKSSKSKDSKHPQPSTSALIICRNKYVLDPAALSASPLDFKSDLSTSSPSIMIALHSIPHMKVQGCCLYISFLISTSCALHDQLTIWQALALYLLVSRTMAAIASRGPRESGEQQLQPPSAAPHRSGRIL